MGKRKNPPQRSNEELCALIQQGDEDCIDELIRQNEGFIHAVMVNLKIQDKGHEQEYMQCGRIGLLRSLSKYDTSRDVKFLTYAKAWIKKEMLAYLNQNIKFQAEIPLTDLDNEDGRAEADQFITDCDPRGLENHVLKNIRLGVLHNCLDTMGPRERAFAIYRYGFCGKDPIGREALTRHFNIPMREVLRLEEQMHEYILESLDVDEALEFFADTVDPEDRKKQEAESYTALFADPAGNYISSQLDAFQGNWELEMAAQA